MRTLTKAGFALSAAAAILVSATAPVAAQTARTEGQQPEDPVMQWAEMMLPKNEFVLNSEQNIELIRYKTERDVEICIAKPDPNTVFGTRTAVPVNVTWDNEVGEVWPGNCLSFDAKEVKVQAAQPLPEDTELLGTFRVIH